MVEREGRPIELGGRQRRALLALLLIYANQRLSAERLAAELWGDPPPPRAVKRVQVAITRLRKTLDDRALRTVGGGYVLDVGPDELDASVFEARLAAARSGDGDTVALLGEALALWRGPPLADVADESFAQLEIWRLEELRLDALELLMDAELDAGHHREVVVELEALAAEHPLRERLHAARMLALYRCGRQAEALEAYREAHRMLVHEAGIEPGPAMRELHAAILRHDVGLELSSALPPELDPTAAHPLVGREEELAWLRARWRSGEPIAVGGPPGIGKTRLAAEFAAEIHDAGGAVLYAADVATVREAAERRPALLVVDGADASGIEGVRVLWLGEQGALNLEPLGDDAVRAIAAGYGAPEDAVREAAGVPRRVHELAREWARREAARRLDLAAGRAAAGRATQRSLEADLAGRVAELRAAREPPARPGVCPFKGLAAFEREDAPYFFGRERLVAELVARLAGARLLGIVGPSGSGKSSVLRAGLLPALADGALPGSDAWRQVLIRPGASPLAELEHALSDVSGRFVLAVDQFEETFTACRDADERAGFIDAIAGAGAGVVVLTLRADFYGRCAAYPALSDPLARNHALVGSLTRDELRRAIEGPARRAGLRVEPRLADALVADVVGEPGALPLLSTTLLELWQERDGPDLRLAAYEHAGGVRGAVARLAEGAYAQLSRAQQDVARRLLQRLADETASGMLVRRRVPLAELQPHGEVVAALADRRLLTISAGTVEVAHEALLREWPRLRAWLEADADSRRLHRRLTAAARDWEASGGDPGDLYRGARLAAAREWRAAHEADLNASERAFLDACDEAERDELEAATRRTRRLRALAAGLLVLAVLAGLSTVLAVRQGQRAESQRRAAVSRSLAVLALDSRNTNVDLAALLGLEAYRSASTSEARNAVLTVLPSLEHNAGAIRTGDVHGLAFASDGRTLALGAADGTVRLVDIAARRPLGAPLGAHMGETWGIASSPDGETLATGSDDFKVRLWNVATRRLRGAPLAGHGGYVNSVAFSPSGATLASGGADGTVRLWDVRAHRALGRALTGHTAPILGVAFSPDGTTLASAGADRVVRLWDVASRRARGRLTGSTGALSSVAFSADGRLLAAGSADRAVHVWDVASLARLARLASPGGAVNAVAFSPAGRTLASAGRDKTIRLWDVAARRLIRSPLTGHNGAVVNLAFSPDRRTLASAGADGTVRFWDLARAPLAQALTGSGRAVDALAFGPDGQTLASAADRVRIWRRGRPLRGFAGAATAVTFSRDGRTLAVAEQDWTIRLRDVDGGRPRGAPLRGHFSTVTVLSLAGSTLISAGAQEGTLRLWDIKSGRQRERPFRIGRMSAVALAPDARTAASAGEQDGTIRLWDVTARRALGPPLAGHSSTVLALAFSRDGRKLASADEDGTVRLWDVPSGRPAGEPMRGHAGAARAVAFDADGATLASAGDDTTIRLWDVTTRRPLGSPLTGPSASVRALAFSPDGRVLASAGRDGTVRLWQAILWSDQPTSLHRFVCAAVRRNLTRAEWREFLPGQAYHATCAR